MPSGIYSINSDTASVNLHSPTAIPNACGFLWNPKMMIQMNCRGYAVAQFMQPEPAKYARPPNIEAQTFMQPEHHYFAHHPGRFVYVKEAGKSLFSMPFEPVRHAPEIYLFEHFQNKLRWVIEEQSIRYTLTLTLAEDEAVEHWTLKIENLSKVARSLSIYPYFPFGYMSWMNQSAVFSPELNTIIASSITPYQKVSDQAKISALKDKSFFASDRTPDSWTAMQQSFEGMGGLQQPDGVMQPKLPQQNACYEVPTAAMQFDLTIEPGDCESFQWLFGPAHNEDEIRGLLSIFKGPNNQPDSATNAPIEIDCPDTDFSTFVNTWLPRQVKYHGESNRLTTDPQTRNYLQDQMGMLYLNPEKAKDAFLFALRQQHSSGEMPDGILLHPDAELKYINQIPHSDHNVWLIIFLDAYIRETGDRQILNEFCPYADAGAETVFDHVEAAMQHLYKNLDERGLSLIHQGDWCDPMNMVGHKGKGVSAWLSMATSYSFKLWSALCEQSNHSATAEYWRACQNQLNQQIREFFKLGKWFARGITDDNNVFGIETDVEGKIFLNPQSWAVLCDAIENENELNTIIEQVEKHLYTPYGPMLLAPSYTKFRADIGRVTQKSPGVAENGSVYNHAAVFYACALFEAGFGNKGYAVLKNMLPSEEDVSQRGQLPVYIPNYYRGAYFQFPQHAGRSSHLFNTGTMAWYYQTVIEGLFGLKGGVQGLCVAPQLPSDWHKASAARWFRGVYYQVQYERDTEVTDIQVSAQGASVIQQHWVCEPYNKHVSVVVKLPVSP